MKSKFIPQMYIEEPPKDYRKPKKIGGGLVQVGANVYEAVRPEDANRRLEESRKNPNLPIPVSTSSPDYIRIFEAAEENEK